MIIIKVVIFFYSYMLFPFLLGLALTGGKEYRTISAMYVQGYFAYFALSYLITTPMIYGNMNNEWAVTIMACIYVTIGIGLMIYSRSFMRRILRHALKEMFRLWNSKERRWNIALSFLMMAVSILFVNPSYMDHVPEDVERLQQSGTIGALQQAQVFLPGSQLPVLYFYGNLMTGMNEVTVIHFALPVAFLALFYACYHEIAQCVFTERTKAAGFYRLCLLFYGLFCFSDSYVGLTVFQNSWNGETILFVCIIPVLFTDLVTSLLNERTKRKRNLIGGNFFFMALAAQLCLQGWLWGTVFMIGIMYLLKWIGRRKNNEQSISA